MKSKVQWCHLVHSDYYGEYEAILNLRDTNFGYRNVNAWPDGKIIARDQPITVKWPNGKTTAEKLRYRIGTGSAQVDMNRITDYFETRTFYISHNLNGKKTEILLKGMKFKRVTKMRRPTELELRNAQRIIFKRALMDIIGELSNVNGPSEIRISRIANNALTDADSIAEVNITLRNTDGSAREVTI
jgi:hypothetical protein